MKRYKCGISLKFAFITILIKCERKISLFHKELEAVY